jgi:hypothetical protein
VDRVGLWANATATPSNSATITGVDRLRELVIWPKLFRRLAAFFQDGNTNLAEFDGWLRADPRDRDDRRLLPNMELGNMHDLIEVSGNEVRLAFLREDVVIVPDDFTLPETPVVCEPVVRVGAGLVRIIGALVDPASRPESRNETVTVIDTTNRDIDLARWSIADNNGRQALDGVLASGETRRVRLGSSVRPHNTRDTITVLDPNEQIVDQGSYEARHLPEEGYTMLFSQF